MPTLNRKCNYCGALIDQSKSTLIKKCEYCGQAFSQNNKYFTGFKDVINLFKKFQFKPKSIKVPQSTKNSLIILSASLFSILIISELSKERWFKPDHSDSDTIEYIKLKKGKWSSKKRYRNYSYKAKFFDKEEPVTREDIVDCKNWEYSKRDNVTRKWRKIQIGSNWHIAMEIICEKPKFKWIKDSYGTKTNTKGQQIFVRPGFWREGKKYRDYDIKWKKRGEKDIIINDIDFDCENWKSKTPWEKSWTNVPESSGANSAGKIVCEKDFNFQIRKEFFYVDPDTGIKYFNFLKPIDLNDNNWIKFTNKLEFQYLSRKNINETYIAARYWENNKPKFVMKATVTCNNSKATKWGIKNSKGEIDWQELYAARAVSIFSRFCQN